MIRTGFDDRVYSANVIATIVKCLEREGVTPSLALEGTRLNPRALHSPMTRVSLNQRLQVYRNAVSLSHDPHFAYHTGQTIHVSTYGMYGFAILSSTSLRQGIEFAARYHQLATPLVDISFRVDDRRGIWSLEPIAHSSIDNEVSRFLIELHLSILITLHRDCMGPEFVPVEIHLQVDPPGDSGIYPRMFGCPVLFAQTQDNLLFDASWLDRAAPLGNEISHYEAVKLCDALMEELRLRAGVTGRIRELLLMSQFAPLSIAAASQQMHMTERTLRRRLSEEQTSFRQLVHELRIQMAVKYLRDTDLTIQEIARAVGFSEEASFRRAIRRATKTAPQQLRDRLKGGSGRRVLAA